MKYAQFVRRSGISRRDFCREMLAGHRDAVKVKKDETAVANLELIFEATLQVSNQKGFQAMSMRDLSRASGLSMGGLYDYFSSKEELLGMIQATGRRIIRRLLKDSASGLGSAMARLEAAIRAHIYLSEAMQPWFFFSYMEARHLGEREKELAKESEMSTERHFLTIVREGMKAGEFGDADPVLAAAVIKAMVQDWYLKRWKYARRRVSVDRYADFVVEAARGLCRARTGNEPLLEEVL